MNVIYATIGRNIGTESMPLDRWHEFLAAVGLRFHMAAPGVTISRHYGQGEWDGVAEESAIITGLTDGPVNESLLRAELAVLAEEFEQDAIACVIAPSILVERATV